MARSIGRCGRILLAVAGTFVMQVPALAAIDDGGAAGRVRGLDPAAQALLTRARTASPTAAALLVRLEQTDLTVRVRVTLMSDALGGDTHLVAATSDSRYLLIRVHAARSPEVQMQFLGHELQHAVEVAAAPDVRDGAGLARLMARIGRKTGGGSDEDGKRHADDTVGLTRAGFDVWLAEFPLVLG